MELGRFTRVSDYVNILSGFFNLQDVVLLTRLGDATRIKFPEFRVRLDEIAIVGQHHPEADAVGSGPWGDTAARVATPEVPPPSPDPVGGYRFAGWSSAPMPTSSTGPRTSTRRPR